MNNIRELMYRACMQQKQLAAMCKVSGPTISDWVNNKKNPSGKNLKRLEEVFGVSSGVILGYDPVPRSAQIADVPEAKKDPATTSGVLESVMRLFEDIEAAGLTDAEADYLRAQIAGIKALRQSG